MRPEVAADASGESFVEGMEGHVNGAFCERASN